MTDLGEIGRLDWLYAPDLPKLFAGLATRARQIFGIKAEQVHVDTTSFWLSGQIVLRLQPLHRLILALLGPLYEQIYNPSG